MENKKIKIGCFGAGQMSTAILTRLHQQNQKYEFYCYTPSKLSAKNLAKDLNGVYVEEINLMPKDLDFYFLGFKPQNLENFYFEFNKDSIVISMLAAKSIEEFLNKFNTQKIVRIMPNTPTLIGMGTILTVFSDCISIEERKSLNNLFDQLGKNFVLKNERQLDIATIFSGSGPALIFEMARIFEEELLQNLNYEIEAKEIILQTFLGSAHLMNYKSDLTFQKLKENVTSKKGVTEKALDTLNQENIQLAFKKAFNSGIKRVEELAIK